MPTRHSAISGTLVATKSVWVKHLKRRFSEGINLNHGLTKSDNSLV